MSTTYEIYKFAKPTLKELSIVDYYSDYDVFSILDEDGEYTVLAVKAAKKTETFTIISDDIKNVIENKVTYYVDGLNSSKTKILTVDKNVTIEYNKGAAQKVLADFEGARDIELMFVENDGDDSYDVIIATEYTSVLVDTVDIHKDRIKKTLLCKTIILIPYRSWQTLNS